MYQVEKKAPGETEACLCAHRDAPGRESQSGGPGRAVPCGAGEALWASRAEGAAMVPVAAGWVTEGRQRG